MYKFLSTVPGYTGPLKIVVEEFSPPQPPTTTTIIRALDFRPSNITLCYVVYDARSMSTVPRAFFRTFRVDRLRNGKSVLTRREIITVDVTRDVRGEYEINIMEKRKCRVKHFKCPLNINRSMHSSVTRG